MNVTDGQTDTARWHRSRAMNSVAPQKLGAVATWVVFKPIAPRAPHNKQKHFRLCCRFSIRSSAFVLKHLTLSHVIIKCNQVHLGAVLWSLVWVGLGNLQAVVLTLTVYFWTYNEDRADELMFLCNSTHADNTVFVYKSLNLYFVVYWLYIIGRWIDF